MYRAKSCSVLGAALALGTALGVSPLAAQTTFKACRVPSVGAIYMIGVAGAPSACLDPSHVEFSWTEGGSAGPGSIGTTELADGAVTQAKLDPGLSIPLGPDAVASANIVDATIVAADLANNSVTAAKIAANAVGTSEISDGSIAATDIADGAVTQAKLDPAISIPLGPDAVTSANILDATIVAADLANNSVTAAKIAANAVGTSEISDGSIATADLADGAVTQAKVDLSTVQARVSSGCAVGSAMRIIATSGLVTCQSFLTGRQVVSATITRAPVGVDTFLDGTVTCPAGKVPVGGGFRPNVVSLDPGAYTDVFVHTNAPNGAAWEVSIHDAPPFTYVDAEIYAICVDS